MIFPMTTIVKLAVFIFYWTVFVHAAWTGSVIKSATAPATKCESWQPSEAITTASLSAWNRRKALVFIASAGTSLVSTKPSLAYTPDPDKLQESLYLMSRVQEATVQQARFVSNSKLQEELGNKMKLTLRLVEKNYRLLDQVNYASAFVQPADAIVEATEAGNRAVEALDSAIEYVRNDLKTGPLTREQQDFLTECMTTTRQELFEFLKYMPADKLAAARQRVEEENVNNREEFDGAADAGVYNPVVLPWKQQ